MDRIRDFIGQIAEISSPDELETLFVSEIRSLGFSSYAYFNFGIIQNGQPLLRHNYDLTWEERYLSEKYAEVDPVFHHGLQAKLPFIWNTNAKQSWSKKQRDMMEEGREAGIAKGFSVPNRSVGFKSSFVTFASDEKDRHFNQSLEKNAHILHVMALHYDARHAELSLPPHLFPPLTPREIECLKWAKDGKSNSEISDILKIAEKTVETHFTNVFNKLSVFSRTHAVVKGLTLGIIAP